MTMRLTKKQSVFTALGILGLFFAVGIGFMKSQTSINLKDFKAESVDIELSPDTNTTDSKLQENQGPAVVLGKFERSESADDGMPLWDIKAETGRYYPETNNAQLEDAVINYYNKGGKKTKMTAKKADIDLDGNALLKAYAYDGVEVDLQGQGVIKTKSVEYYKKTESVKSEDKVEIIHEIMETTGYGLEGNVATQEFVLLDRVTSVIKPQKK